jgi:Flp pilus assembly pilin Flp
VSRGGRPDAERGGRGGSGQGVVEYGLIAFLVVVVCLISLLFFGDQLSALLTLIADQV